MKKIWPVLLSLTILAGCVSPYSKEGPFIAAKLPTEAPTEVSVPTLPPTPTPTEVPAPTLTPVPIPTEEPELPVYPDPITGFFESCRFEPGVSCTPFDSYFASLKAEAWRREAEHMFQILKENAHPDIQKIGVCIEQIETDFQTFVKAQSELYAYIAYTSALDDEVGQWGEQVFHGTGFSQGYELARTNLYETVVKDFYAYGLHYPKGGESYVSDYVFDPNEVLTELESNNIACTVEPYEIEIPIFKWSEELENPIDTWVEDNHLYSDGTTLALSCDAHMEADIWKAELEHLYSLLQAHSNPIAELDPLIQRAKKAYFAFVPAFGEVESLYSHSGLFMLECWEKNVYDDFVGTIHKVERWTNQMYYYRGEVFRLREALCDRMGEEKVDWAFDPAPYEAEMREFYGEDWGKG